MGFKIEDIGSGRGGGNGHGSYGENEVGRRDGG